MEENKETENRWRVVLTPSYEAVIFDLDGSLVDSMWVWKDIDDRYLADHGIHTEEDIQKLIGGISMQQTTVLFREHFGITDPPEKMIADWNAMALERYSREVRIKPGGMEVLAWCRAHGIRTAVATSNSRELTDAALKGTGAGPWLDVVVTGSEITNGKPAPDVYLHTAQRLQADPAHCLVFEDLVDGIRAGKAAGMQVIAVLDPTTAGDNAEKIRLADAAVRDFTDLDLQSGQEQQEER